MAVKIDVHISPESGHPLTKRPLSIMEPYLEGMRLIKLLGLPLKTRFGEDGSIEFEDHLRLVKGGFATAFAVLCAFFPFSMHYIGGLSMTEGVKLGASKYGFQKWDWISGMMYGLPSVFGSVAQSLAFQGLGNELTKFTKLYANHPGLIPMNHRDMYSRVWWRVVIMNVWTLPIIATWFVWAKFYMYPDELTTLVSWIWGIGAIFIAHYFFLIPASSATMELALYCLALIKETLHIYHQSLKATLNNSTYKSANEDNNKDLAECALDDGQAIIELMSVGHATFGSFVLILYAIYLFLGCIGLFNGTAILQILSGEISPLMLLLSTSAICFLSLSITVIYSLARTGQYLADLYSKIKDCLQELLILKANGITKKERVELELLIDKLSASCPFQPLDIFDVNMANAIQMAGLFFTYDIVLLQFKIDDRYQAPDNHFNNISTF